MARHRLDVDDSTPLPGEVVGSMPAGAVSIFDPEEPHSMPSRSDMVAELIERAIFAGEFAPGDRLVERDLASRLAVSKTPVREALKSLASRGLVTPHAYRGVRVPEITAQFVAELYGVRLLLEPPALEISIKASPAAGFHAAREALERGDFAMTQNDLASLALANRDFHAALTVNCTNQLQLRILDDLRDQVALVNVWTWRSGVAPWSSQREEHEAILTAAESGDAARSSRELSMHIQRALDGALIRLTDAADGN
jgi:DNA-binding GntR family transcriptional regulator